DQQLEKGGGHYGNRGDIVVANRNSGSISVINTKTDEVSGTYQLPAGPNTPEPMYVVFVKRGRRVFVGDRANNQVVVFNSSNYSVVTTIPVGQGVFHMWADKLGKQLWVNNDIDNTTSVIDLHSLQVIATVPTPADLVSMGGKPHDVFLGPFGRLAYVSVVGVSGASDYVVQFNTRTFEETGRTAVGKDPHLSIPIISRFLYVPCQNSDAVYVLNRFNMNQVKIISVPGAHGVNITTNGKVLYTTNLPGGGTNGLFAINTRNKQVIGSSNTPYPVPHNIALTPSSKKLYLTHSGGTSDKVTVYKISKRHPVPEFLKEITVELNPFGLAYAK
ncbi:MAG: beta-propeller fold lactonase family protein, partial [Ignavibacteriaceae bacterium]|nr:beta-propeller fold lactonase family protein [Ignavibacteriaceae bacterium]